MTTTTETLDLSFPPHVSASSREVWITCRQKWVFQYLLQREPPKSIHLIAGGAFARGLEIARQSFYGLKDSEPLAWKKGQEALIESYKRGTAGFAPDADYRNKTLPHMMGALQSYAKNWPFEHDYFQPVQLMDRTDPAVEFSFAIPLIGLDHPDTGEPILLKGNYDAIMEHRSTKQRFVVDDKTASQLGNQWMKQWYLDSQPTIYIQAARDHGFEVAGCVMRGTSILKNGYGHAEQAETRSPVFLNNYMSQLYQEVLEQIELYKALKRHHIGAPEGFRHLIAHRSYTKSTCGAYGGCDFQPVCKSDGDPRPWLRQMTVARSQRDASPVPTPTEAAATAAAQDLLDNII